MRILKVCPFSVPIHLNPEHCFSGLQTTIIPHSPHHTHTPILFYHFCHTVLLNQQISLLKGKKKTFLSQILDFLKEFKKLLCHVLAFSQASQYRILMSLCFLNIFSQDTFH